MDQLQSMFWLEWLSKLQLSELHVCLSQLQSLDQPPAAPAPAELQPASSIYTRLFSRRVTPAPCPVHKSHETMPSSKFTGAAPGVCWTFRCLPALALALPTLFSLYLAITHTKVYGSTSLVTFVRGYRASVQILLQILAHVLSVAQVYCICKLFNFSTRLRIKRGAITLRQLSLWSALSNVKTDWNLPPLYLLLTISVVALSIVPEALWAGALTPVETIGRNLTASVDVASYSARSVNTWNSDFALDEYNNLWNQINNCTTINDFRGLIPSCPVPGLQALLLLSASKATTVDRTPRLHGKLDNPRWTYSGRSYGVGSSAGLTLPSFGFSEGSDVVSNMNYLESGYKAQATCSRNSSSNITIGSGGIFGPDPIGYFVLEGRLPNEPPVVHAEYYPIPAFPSAFEKIAAWAARSWKGRNVLAIATGSFPSSQMSILDKIQCEVEFASTQFLVSVNLTNKSITTAVVSSLETDIEPSGNLKANVIQSLNLLSRMSPSLYESLVGNALMMNIKSQRIRINATEIDDEIVARAVEDSMMAMIDDILVSYGASQLLIASDSLPVPAFGNAYGVHVGDPVFIYAVLVMNMVILAVCLVESIRTRFWSGLPRFNYVDFKSMVLVALAGGADIAEAFQPWRKRINLDEWDGDGSHSAFDAIRIQICNRCVVAATIGDTGEIRLHDDELGNSRGCGP